jgi:hypothetical protein
MDNIISVAVGIVQYSGSQIVFHLKNWCTLWDFMNIVLPIIVPFVGMGTVMCMRTTDARHAENAKFLVTIKDGQLGYIAVVMDLVMIYDLTGKTMTSAAVIACLTGAAAIALGTVVAAHGAVYTTPLDTAGKTFRQRVKHFAVMWFSVAVTVGAAMLFHHSHHYLVESAATQADTGTQHGT